ncbi:MAG: glycolate oxidase, partial [Gemmatimonadetes bacterium]|nr:glycolate oxidase [Gemmatimonadota bacterium]
MQYGHGLEAARQQLAAARGVPRLARLALWALTSSGVSRIVYWFARVLRATGIPRRLAGWNRFRFAMGMLAATRAVGRLSGSAVRRTQTPTAQPPNRLTALLFRGCVQQGLFSHVHDATVRTLGVNGYGVREVRGQGCCGALHAHAGLLDAARALARANVTAFGDGAEPIVVNSAGCGALMKDYGHLLGDEAAQRFGARVRDVTELLAGDAMRGPLA